jgi:hypothetical protein
MSELRLMPRLDNHGVRRLIGMPDLLRTGSISERVEAAGSSVSYGSSGGSRADAADLTELQEQIVALAKRFGFPNEGRAAGRASFDAECAQWLVEAPIISGGEALRDDVWAFVACCIAPEVVLWRFEDGHADRFHGGLRNTFQRLWLRARSLDRGAGAPNGGNSSRRCQRMRWFRLSKGHPSGATPCSLAQLQKLGSQPRTGLVRAEWRM